MFLRSKAQNEILKHFTGIRLTHSLPANAEVVVVGGGVVGASTAYHLSKMGAGPGVLLLESDKITCGTTWHSAAMLNTLRSNVVEAKLVNYTKMLASQILEVNAQK